VAAGPAVLVDREWGWPLELRVDEPAGGRAYRACCDDDRLTVVGVLVVRLGDVDDLVTSSPAAAIRSRACSSCSSQTGTYACPSPNSSDRTAG
jgi:hypothetical protein